MRAYKQEKELGLNGFLLPSIIISFIITLAIVTLF
jgi:hypothetical protein